MKSYKEFNEARMSAAVKLQRAFERQQQKSEASRRRGEELLKKPIVGSITPKPTSLNDKISQANEEVNTVDEASTGNPGRGYHGSVQTPDDKYEATHKHVKNLTDADDKTVKHYLDSGHGRHLAGKEDDHEYIKKDFAKFCKYYNPETLQNKKVNEVITKATPAGEVISDFVHSDNPKFAGKSKDKRKQMALAAYYSKQRNEGTIQINGTDKLETAGNNVPAKTPKGKTVKGFKFFATEEVDETYNGPRGDKLIARSHAAFKAGDKETSSRAHKLAMKAGQKYRSNPENNAKAIAHIMSGASQDYKDQEKKRGIGHVRDHVELEGELTEANHREFACSGCMHPDMAKNMKAGQETDFYHSKTGDKISGVVKHNSGSEVHIKANKDGKMGAGEVHKYKVTSKLDESFEFDTAAMAKQELASVKNAKKRKRGKIANLLRAAGLKENEMEKLSFKEFASALQEAKKVAQPVNVDKVNHAGDAPHEEKWEDAKGVSKVKKESFSADALLAALKEGMWPGTPEYNAKFGGAKQGGGAGIKKGTRYGGSLQKDEPEHDEDDAPKAGRPTGAKSGARKNLGNSKLHK